MRETVSVGERYLEIVENIAGAAKQAGRAPQEITLLAVTKFVDAARVREAL